MRVVEAAAVPSFPTEQSTSEATWHVVFWLLMTLAISSMGQPTSSICGISSRHRIYLASSPIVCMANAICLVSRLLATVYYLNISFSRASQLVRFTDTEKSRSGAGANSAPQHLQHTHSWPRVLFFIIGTLPAAIKITALSGVPWTKAWGLMYMASFVTVEAMGWMASSSETTEGTTIDEILDLASLEHVSGAQQALVFRAKARRLDRKTEVPLGFLYGTTFIAHLVLILWAVFTIWIPAAAAVKRSETMSEVSTWLLTLVYLADTVYWITLMIRRVPGRKWWHETLSRPSTVLFLATFAMQSAPRTMGHQTSVSRIQKFNEDTDICWFIAILYVILRVLAEQTAKRWPRISKALLLNPEERKINHNPQRRTDSSDPHLEDGGHLIDDGAWVSFCFFLGNLTLCTLWYAFIYDPTGTINPPWTDVFG